MAHPAGPAARPAGDPERPVRLSPANLRGEKISQTLARRIARDIAEQQLAPGARLPHEVVMAQQFQVGRNTVREALRLLEAQGLVEIRPGPRGGPVVGRPTGNDFGRTMTLFLQMQGITVGEVLDAQAGIDGVIAATAAHTVSSIPREKLEALTAASRVDLSELSDADWLQTSMKFHNLLQELAPNRVLALIDDAVREVLTDRVRSDQHTSWSPAERRRITQDHMNLVDAIRDGDGQAAWNIARTHQERSNESIRRLYPGLVDQLIDWH
jgi:DNA-binding FadR family transcriptional regulator